MPNAERPRDRLTTCAWFVVAWFLIVDAVTGFALPAGYARPGLHMGDSRSGWRRCPVKDRGQRSEVGGQKSNPSILTTSALQNHDYCTTHTQRSPMPRSGIRCTAWFEFPFHGRHQLATCGAVVQRAFQSMRWLFRQKNGGRNIKIKSPHFSALIFLPTPSRRNPLP